MRLEQMRVLRARARKLGPSAPIWMLQGNGYPERNLSSSLKSWLTGEMCDLFADRGRLLRTGRWSRSHPGPFIRLARRILAVLERAKIDYCVIGGLAVGLYGQNRSTRDVDIQIEVDSESLAAFVRQLRRSGFRQVGPGWQTAAEVGRLRVRLAGSNATANLFVADTMADRLLVAGRRRVRILGQPVWVCSAEDLILMKLKAGRWQDHEDVRSILAERADRVDRRSLLADAAVRGLRPRLIRLAREAGLRWR